MSGMSGPWKVVTSVAVALSVAGVGAAGWCGLSWWSATKHNATSTIAARDSALEAAKRLAVTMETSDPAQPEQDYQTWEAAATGPLLTKLQQEQQKYLAQLKQSPTRSVASVVEAALSDLDADAGTATALVAVDISQAAVRNGMAGQSTQRQLRMKMSLSRTGAGWKLAGWGPVKF